MYTRSHLILGIAVAALSIYAQTSPDSDSFYSLQDLYNRLDSGSAGTAGAFTQPGGAPGAPAGKTLNEIMAIAPAVHGSAAAASQVLSGRYFWSLDGSGWGQKAGTMTNRGAVTLTPGTADQTIAAGYHTGSGKVTGDADLVAGNIRRGVTLFNVAGDTNVVNTSSGTATASNIDGGTIAYVKGSRVAGSRYTVTYHLFGGYNNEANPAFFTPASNEILIQSAMKPDSVFEGWYTDAARTHSVSTIPQGTTSNLDLYAKWIGYQPSTIIFANGTSVSRTLGSGNYTNAVSGAGDGAIRYTSETEAVATVNPSTGAVTLVGSGTTKITANKAATATHAAVSADYTLTVQLVITQQAIAGVTAPVTGATPATTITETDQYTGTIVWSGTPATFAANIVYTATITLSAKAGYSLTGVTADFFTVAGATSVTNPLNSGTVTALFPATFLLVTVGDSYGGGTVFAVSQTSDLSQAVTTGSGRHGLIMANTDQVNYNSNANHGVTWSSAGTSVSGASSFDNGAANTSAIIAAFPSDNSSNNAARAARNYIDPTEGHTDWYLPSKNELNKMYEYASAHNLIGSGCSGSVADGVQCLVGGYDPTNKQYWSSSENSGSSDQAQYEYFSNGIQSSISKNYTLGVRAIRAFGN